MIFREKKFVLSFRFFKTKFIIPFILNIFKKFGIKLTRNNDIFEDIKSHFSDYNNLVIFDVGAYTGNSLFAFKKIFPNSFIYSFEPSSDNYLKLKKNSENLTKYKIFNLGISNIDKIKKFNNNSWSMTSSFVDLNKHGSKKFYDKRFKYLGTNHTKNISLIDSISIDTFLKRENISNVDILKIDTQGHEKNVLQGAKRSLKENKINAIMIEVILDDYYENQLNISDIENLIINDGFYLFGIYDMIKMPKRRINQIDLLYLKKIN